VVQRTECRKKHLCASEPVFGFGEENAAIVTVLCALYQVSAQSAPVAVRAGASIYISADVYHSTINTSWEPLRLLVVYTPAGPERLLRDIPGWRLSQAVCSDRTDGLITLVHIIIYTTHKDLYNQYNTSLYGFGKN